MAVLHLCNILCAILNNILSCVNASRNLTVSTNILIRNFNKAWLPDTPICWNPGCIQEIRTQFAGIQASSRKSALAVMKHYLNTLLPSKFAPFIFRSLYISLPLIFAPLESNLLPLIFAPLIDL